MTDSTIKKNFYDGNNQCTTDNLDFFKCKLQDHINNNTKMTFRQWINKVISLLDIIN